MALQPTEIKTVVTLPIRKEEHVDFLRSMFDGTRGQPIKINRNKFLGRHIFSLRKYSSCPTRQVIPEGYVATEIEFPYTPHSTSEKNFCYFPLEHVEQINDFISAVFDLFFHIYFFDTRDIENREEQDEFGDQEITREILVDSFVVGLDMIDLARANETIKKRIYRRQMKEMERKRKKFLRKDYNFRKEIYLRRRNNLKIIMFESLK